MTANGSDRGGDMNVIRREPIYLSWSGGKDCALALFHLRNSPEYDVVRLQTTVTEDYDRSSIHGIRRPLLRTQANLLGLDVHEVVLPVSSSYDSYEEAMLEALEEVRTQGIRKMAFGDLLLEDVREYREQLLARAGIEAIFPLWGEDTRAIGEELIERGFVARLIAVDTHMLAGQFVGRMYDRALLDALPPGVDPAGEKGEFHTFVSDGPIFSGPVPYVSGAVEKQERTWYMDLQEIPERAVLDR